MIDYTNFIIALKSSWIRRLIIAKNSKWKTLFETEFGISIADVLKFGSNFDPHFVFDPNSISGIILLTIHQ